MFSSVFTWNFCGVSLNFEYVFIQYSILFPSGKNHNGTADNCAEYSYHYVFKLVPSYKGNVCLYVCSCMEEIVEIKV